MKTAEKIMNWQRAAKACTAWRDMGDRVVFTNGCFDILHKGHIQYLEQASELGQRMIIGLNSDDSTQRLKGPGRPINRQDSRAFVIAAMSFVDAVVVFDEDTPLELIRHLSPGILVKGGDYNADDVVGGDHVRANGGQVVILPYLEGFSTTSIEQRILGRSDK